MHTFGFVSFYIEIMKYVYIKKKYIHIKMSDKKHINMTHTLNNVLILEHDFFYLYMNPFHTGSYPSPYNFSPLVEAALYDKH